MDNIEKVRAKISMYDDEIIVDVQRHFVAQTFERSNL